MEQWELKYEIERAKENLKEAIDHLNRIITNENADDEFEETVLETLIDVTLELRKIRRRL